MMKNFHNNCLSWQDLQICNKILATQYTKQNEELTELVFERIGYLLKIIYNKKKRTEYLLSMKYTAIYLFLSSHSIYHSIHFL